MNYFLIISLFLLPLISEAKTYQCVDENGRYVTKPFPCKHVCNMNGRRTYSDEPCVTTDSPQEIAEREQEVKRNAKNILRSKRDTIHSKTFKLHNRESKGETEAECKARQETFVNNMAEIGRTIDPRNDDEYVNTLRHSGEMTCDETPD